VKVSIVPTTEDRDPQFADIDNWPTKDAVEAMLDGQLAALSAIRGATGAIAMAAEAAAERLSDGGRLVYAGAGTSGRVAVQDGVELGPTFGWPDDRLVYLPAGGMAALSQSAEGAEDDAEAGRAAVADHCIGSEDVVIGVTASGRTPYTISILENARKAAALTISIANNPDSPMLSVADHAILAATGSEIIAGSTRMKAGTAQKAILNMLSTAIMLRLGRVYRGMMVDMQISNDKLLKRAQAIVASLAACPDDVAARALEATGRNIKAAVLVAMGDTPEQAMARLDAHDGILRSVIEQPEGRST
jgi:N-acetylmuramic acid 6-phosphate etherase